VVEKIIIDTDPGIDDAFAIFYALRSAAFDVLGLTTVYGNASVEQTTHNALALVAAADRACPVARGASDPMEIERRAYPTMVHGEDGMGGCAPETVSGSVIDQHAVDFIIETVRARPGEVTLVPIGPLTNIGLALQKDPGLASLTKRVVLMGGAAQLNGNVTPAAEANIYDDPHAAEMVFSADWEVVMLGLDATHDVHLTENTVAELAREGGAQGRFLQQASAQYFGFHRDVVGLDFCHFHDPSALIYCVRPDLFTVQPSSVRVVTDGFAAGKTVAKPDSRFTGQAGWEKRARVSVCLAADGDAVIEHFVSAMQAKPSAAGT